MLSKRHRFLFQKGVPKKVASSPFFVLRYQPNDEGALKLAVVVSKKVDKRATRRNELKRIIKAGVEAVVDVESPVSLVFYLRKEIAEQESHEIQNEVKKVLSELKKHEYR